MVRIKITDLSPNEEGKSINELTAWEIKNVYAGMQRRFGRDTLSDSSGETPSGTSSGTSSETSGFSLNGMSGSISSLMDNLEVQLRDIRGRLGI
ncbi:hypothetical protein [Anabaena azotica]|uniref:Uncharacterized protein n=1 Tax=Anabaena azotica FACHB-119 TaxID=947527 RepID=A0ABR8DAK0_9NOST|nr:hypothetical protein [Anabaena azotica]MBD2502763.1 hypothetical protein [Anabaena azotica FACHB-119]